MLISKQQKKVVQVNLIELFFDKFNVQNIRLRNMYINAIMH